MRSYIPALAAIFCVLPGATRAQETLENAHVSVTVEPRKGGAVSWMIHKRADTFPYYADKGQVGGGLGLGTAGRGQFFVPVLRAGTTAVNLASATLVASREKADAGEQVLKLSGEIKGTPLTFERTIHLAVDESGFRMTDRFRNGGPAAVELRPGTSSDMPMAGWMATVLTGFGEESTHRRGSGSVDAKPLAETAELKSDPFYWRMVSQWGVGMLYQVRGVKGPVTVQHERSLRGATGVKFHWEGAPTAILPGQTLTVEQSVLIDTGAREGSNSQAATLAKSDRLLVTPDLRAAGLTGDVLPGTATVVSAVPRKVNLAVTRSLRGFDGKELEPASSLVVTELTLAPGRAVIRPLEVRATQKGILRIAMTVRDEQGQALASASADAVIDGEGQAGEIGAIGATHARKLPETICKGTWARIGADLVRAGKINLASKPDPKAAERLALYRRKFPYYDDLLVGAARTLETSPEKLVALGELGGRPEQACMDIFFDGPDGPINAFSKERFDQSLNGLGYIKIVPDRGYAYHLYYMPPGRWEHGYGVNSEGLSTSGASINCDNATEEKGVQVTKAWKDAGKAVAPIPMHMLLATCKTVDEAIAFIEDPEAPYEFDGNMLIVDRAGNAARLESVGLHRQIHRYKKPEKGPTDNGYFVAGNYSHDRADGCFKAGGWSLATNTMLRETFLRTVAGGRMGKLSLQDVVWLMESHAAGGMCQHIVENRARLYTSTSFIAVCRTSELWLSAGPPCQVRYQRYRLNDHTSGR